MKGVLLIIITLFVFNESDAQKKPTGVEVGIQSGIFILYEFDWHYGFNTKLLLPLKNENEITFNAAYLKLIERRSYSIDGSKNYIYSYIPFTIGYRGRFKDFFLEPQLGFGIILEEYNVLIPSVEVGYLRNRFKVALQYQQQIESDFIGDISHIIGLQIGYRIR